MPRNIKIGIATPPLDDLYPIYPRCPDMIIVGIKHIRKRTIVTYTVPNPGLSVNALKVDGLLMAKSSPISVALVAT